MKMGLCKFTEKLLVIGFIESNPTKNGCGLHDYFDVFSASYLLYEKYINTEFMQANKCHAALRFNYSGFEGGSPF